ncbi:DUF4190 domain-containing protein [Nonomuraea sp. NPDC049725]|uniref:DUF4190 domain-containing protein n=1 Tax=Nonomuraea sp. NPDC049725 TaxID=3154508 RepID=UPI00342CCA48
MSSVYEGDPHGRQAPTSGLATASLVFGIIGLIGCGCLFGIPSIVAIVLGHAATGKTRPGLRGGHGLAVAGLILGYVVLVPAIVVSGIMVYALITEPAMVAGWVNDLFSALGA